MNQHLKDLLCRCYRAFMSCSAANALILQGKLQIRPECNSNLDMYTIGLQYPPPSFLRLELSLSLTPYFEASEMGFVKVNKIGFPDSVTHNVSEPDPSCSFDALWTSNTVSGYCERKLLRAGFLLRSLLRR